ncbi:MAG: shikimate kinase [Gammaproteobacteria bacterium]|nr:shikimate kinase [Gammaproteobacteria bacterium]
MADASISTARRHAGKRLALVGLPGSGKTTVGRLLAHRLGFGFCDCDARFETDTGWTIGAWVAENGWPAFRARESDLLLAVLKRDQCVIATGGGVVEYEKNRSALAGRSRVVWLDAPIAVLQSRLSSAPARPLLGGKPNRLLADLARQREPLYREIADFVVAAGSEGPEGVVDRVVHGLNLSRDRA